MKERLQFYTKHFLLIKPARRAGRLLPLLLALILLVSVPLQIQAAPKNGWNSRKTIYYKNGTRYTGQERINGKWYLFKKGRLQTGFQTVENPVRTVYYAKKTGEMLTGFQKIKGKTYYFLPRNGKMKTGWMNLDGLRYYFSKKGQMATGQIKKGKKYYWFNSKGVLCKVYTAALKKQIQQERTTKTPASALASLSNEELIETIGPLFTEDEQKTGILASISMAQFILESGYGRSLLTLKANNCFGMKENLSGNTWMGTRWNGKSVYRIRTGEEDRYGNRYTIMANFRKYSCVEDSIADHSAYLCGAKNDGALRYLGIKGCKSYEKAARILKQGGYATSSSYVSSLCRIIQQWNLTRFETANAVHMHAE